MEKRTDTEVLMYYRDGRVRRPDENPGQIRFLKDVGYLSCTFDLALREEYLTTTELGNLEVSLNRGLIPGCGRSPERRRRRRTIAGILRGHLRTGPVRLMRMT